MEWSVIIKYEDGTWSCDDIVCRGSKRDRHSVYDVFLGKTRIGMTQSIGEGWSATPQSSRYDRDSKITGPLSVAGFRNRRAAIHYLLQAENYYVHDSLEPNLRKGTGRYLDGGTQPNPKFKE